MSRFLPPLLLVALVVGTSPAIGRIRDRIFELFPDSAVRLLAIALAVLAAGLFLYAAVRIRERRLLRYGGLAAVGVLLWIQTAGFSTGLASVDIVEKVHIIEYGLLAFLLYRALLPAGDLSVPFLTLLGVTFAGTLEEWVQWFVPARLGEIRDVFLNVFAGTCGLVFGLSIEPPSALSWRLTAPRWRILARATALIVVALGLFVTCAHLGHEIEDPEIGRFRSWFTAEEIREIRELRRREWAVAPPTGVEIWGKEDYFLTEAAWHANHRNETYRRGDFYMAWQANRILEKYYDPFLDIDSFRGSGKHRYPPAVRRDLAARVPRRDPQGYLSPVLRERIYPWPKPIFVAALLSAGGLFWILPRFLSTPTRPE